MVEENPLSEFKDLFISEAKEVLRALNTALVELEKNPSSTELLNEIFRLAHTIKGLAATMNYPDIVRLSHDMESVLDVLRKDASKMTRDICAALFEACDVLNGLVAHVETSDDPLPSSAGDISRVIGKLNAIAPAVPAPSRPPEELPTEERRVLRLEPGQKFMIAQAAQKGISTYTVKIVLTRDCAMVEARMWVVLNVLKSAGDIINEPYVHNQIKSGKFGRSLVAFLMTPGIVDNIKKDIQAIQDVETVDFQRMPEAELDTASAPQASSSPDAFPHHKHLHLLKQTIRVPVKKIDQIVNLVGELVINGTRLETIGKSLESPELGEHLAALNRLLTELHREAMDVRLIPMAVICDHFPRMVRDLAKSHGKDVNLEITGAELGLDRAILDEIKDPLIHMLRNCVDHGIEMPAVRQQLGKNPAGLIKIHIRKEGGLISIEVADDGRGMDIQRIKDKALSMGIITPQEAGHLDDRAAMMLVTAPGLTTSDAVTATSGRGVGLDMVKKKVELFGGSLMIDTEPSRGSTFVIRLPVSLTILKALLVKIRDQIYAVPICNILRIADVSGASVRTVDNRRVIVDQDQTVPLIDMGEAFGFGCREFFIQDRPGAHIPVLITQVGHQMTGLLVDELVTQQDVVVKGLDEHLRKIKGIGGATILGSGQVALIVDVPSLI